MILLVIVLVSISCTFAALFFMNYSRGTETENGVSGTARIFYDGNPGDKQQKQNRNDTRSLDWILHHSTPETPMTEDKSVVVIPKLFPRKQTENDKDKMSPDDQAKVLAGLDVTRDSLTFTRVSLESVADALRSRRKTSVLNIIRTASRISEIMSFVPAVALVNLIFTIYQPSQLQVIKEQFDIVNNQLNKISFQIQDIKYELRSLRSFIEYNTWKTTFTKLEWDIQNGEAKLKEMQDRLAREEDMSLRLKIKTTFIHYFENADIQGAAMNVHKVTALDSASRKNLFELYVKERDCDMVELSKLMIAIRHLMTSAARQSFVYEILKYGKFEYAREKANIFFHLLYDIRRQYLRQVWYCVQNIKENAKEVVKHVISTNADKGISKERISKQIHKRLSNLSPWHNWAVVFYTQAANVTINFSIYAHTSSTCSGHRKVSMEYFDEEDQFLLLPKLNENNDTNILLSWQDINDESQGCKNADNSNTFIALELCPSCSTDVMTASSQIINGNDCMDYLSDIVLAKLPDRDQMEHCRSDISKTLSQRSYSFIAAGFSSSVNQCSAPNVCNNRGVCRHIPGTSSHICLCEEYYEGENCEEYHDPTVDKMFNESIFSFLENTITDIEHTNSNSWGAWTPWSSCSKTCGGGERTRQRRMPQGTTMNETNVCSTHECCHPR